GTQGHRGLLELPIGDRNAVAVGGNGDLVAVVQQGLFRAFQQGVVGHAPAGKRLDQRDGERVTGLLGQVFLQLDDRVGVGALVAGDTVVADVLGVTVGV